jgi:hypothetical protein
VGVHLCQVMEKRHVPDGPSQLFNYLTNQANYIQSDVPARTGPSELRIAIGAQQWRTQTENSVGATQMSGGTSCINLASLNYFCLKYK